MVDNENDAVRMDRSLVPPEAEDITGTKQRFAPARYYGTCQQCYEISGWYAGRHCEESGLVFRVGTTKQSHSESRQKQASVRRQSVRFENLTPRVTAFGGSPNEIASSPFPHFNPAPRNDASHATR